MQIAEDTGSGQVDKSKSGNSPWTLRRFNPSLTSIKDTMNRSSPYKLSINGCAKGGKRRTIHVFSVVVRVVYADGIQINRRMLIGDSLIWTQIRYRQPLQKEDELVNSPQVTYKFFLTENNDYIFIIITKYYADHSVLYQLKTTN